MQHGGGGGGGGADNKGTKKTIPDFGVSWAKKMVASHELLSKDIQHSIQKDRLHSLVNVRLN